MDQIEIRLFSKDDKHGDEYFIGSTDAPALVDLTKSTFVFFLPQEGKTTATLKIRPRQERRPSLTDEPET
jgi:hypothetical protein